METGIRFTRVALGNWRNFSRAEVGLRRESLSRRAKRFGKSNFLDVFRFLHDLVAVGGGFQEAVLERRGVSSLRCYAARRYPDISIQADIGTDENPAIWKYERTSAQDNNQRPFHKEKPFIGENKILDRPNPEDLQDTARLKQTYLEQVNVNREFRDISEFFSAVPYRHLVPQLVRDPRTAPVGPPRATLTAGDFLEQIASAPDRTT